MKKVTPAGAHDIAGNRDERIFAAIDEAELGEPFHVAIHVLAIALPPPDNLGRQQKV